MNESLIIFCREWAVTAAITALLAPDCSRPASAVCNLEHLTRVLREQPHSPVVLGLRPHEHVADLYRLRPLLAGRAVLFVARSFYWTDYNLPEWLGLWQYGFCSWDTMQNPFSRRMELRRFRQFSADAQEEENMGDKTRKRAPAAPAMTDMQILKNANQWLYRELSVTGLTGFEIRELSLMTEGQKSNLPSRTCNLLKNKGLYKLGMFPHVMNLFRGVKVRPALQAVLPVQDEESQTGGAENIIPFRQETDR